MGGPGAPPARAHRNGRPREHTEVTQVLRERPPAWEGDAPEPPGRAERRREAPDEPRRRRPPDGGPPGDPPSRPTALF